MGPAWSQSISSDAGHLDGPERPGGKPAQYGYVVGRWSTLPVRLPADIGHGGAAESVAEQGRCLQQYGSQRSLTRIIQ